MQPVPTRADIEAAARRIAGVAVETPLLSSPLLDQIAGGRVLVKAECLQRTGSFKFRGAYNRISQLDRASAPGGVVAYSSGNHGQGVAAAAQLMGLPALVVMPSDTPQIKQDNTRRYGAEVVLYDRVRESREEIAARLAQERGAVLVPPFEDFHVIAGQGTAGLEIGADVRLDQMLVCCSGGGLSSGIAIAMAPETKIYTVEPAGFDDMARSLARGERLRNDSMSGSICDALLTPEPGETTFAIAQELIAGGLSVTDDEVLDAMNFAYTQLKLVAEPGGAVALAAVLSGRIDTRGRTTGVIISGGNADPVIFTRAIARPYRRTE